jgi:hypothetical protein
VVGIISYLNRSPSSFDLFRTMSDVDGPMIADSFYEAVLKEEMFDLNVVPYALDDAVKSLRDRKVEARRWSVFVHMGA